MAEYSLGRAVGQIVIDPSGAKRGFEEATRSGQGFINSVSGLSDRMVGLLGGAARTAGRMVESAMTTAAVAVGTLLTTAAVGGFRRFTALENAQKMLDQMGLSAQQSDALMEALNETLTGTAFALDEGAGVMARLVGASVPLEEIPGRLDMIADAAAFGQAPMSEIGDIFARIAGQGRVTAQELNRLTDRNIPAFGLLAEAIGVTEMELRDLVSQGKLDADTFFEAWEEGAKGFGENGIIIEGAAKSMGDTTMGALSNMRAAISRFGARAFEPIFQAIKPLSESFGRVLNELAPTFERAIGGMMDSPGVQAFINFMQELPDLVGPIMDKLGDLDTRIVAPLAAAFGALGIGAAGSLPVIGGFLPAISPVLAAFLGLIAASPELRDGILEVARAVGDVIGPALADLQPAIENLLPVFGELAEAILPVLGDLLVIGAELAVALAPAIIEAITVALEGLTGAIRYLDEELNVLAPTLAGIAGGLLAFRAIGPVLTVLSALGTALGFVAAVVTSPFFLIPAAVAALVAGIVLAYQHSETFRDVIARIGEVITDVAGHIVDFGGEVLDILGQVAGWIQDNVFPVFVAFGELVVAAGGQITSTIQRWMPLFRLIGGIISQTLRNAQTVIMGFISVVQNAWRLFGDNLLSAIRIAWGMIEGILRSGLQVLQGIFQVFTGILSGDWSKLWEGIKNILSGAWTFITTLVGTAIDTVLLVIETALDAIHLAWDTAWQAVSTALRVAWDTMARVVGQQVGAIVDWLRGLPGRAVDALSSLAGALSDLAMRAMSRGRGMFQGFINGWSAIRDWVRELPGNFLNALGSLRSILLNAGREIMNGLWEGLQEIWERVKGWLQSLTSWIPDWKGPPDKDKVLLTENGRLIMEGFLNGLRQGLPPVMDLLNDVAPTIQASMDISPSGISPAGGAGPISVTLQFNGPVGAGAGQEVLDAIRGPGVFDDIVRGVRSGRRG